MAGEELAGPMVQRILAFLIGRADGIQDNPVWSLGLRSEQEAHILIDPAFFFPFVFQTVE
jgi:hypothetical protein